MEYLVHEDNMEKLNKKMTRIGNKCKKYGTDFKFEVVGEKFETTENGEVIRYVVVDVEGNAIINDWEFVASVDYLEGGNVIRAIQGQSVPVRYYTEKPVCEHCHTNHERVHTYIVKNVKTGEYKQVGSSCLCDYTHGMDAEFAVMTLDFEKELTEAKDYCGGGRFYYNTEKAVEWAVTTVKKFGYVSVEKKFESMGAIDKTTRERVANYYRNIDVKADGVEVSEQDKADAKTMIEWAKAQNTENAYIHNLSVIAKSEYVDGKHFGMLVSLPVAYARAMDKIAKEKAQAEKNAESKYVGNVGEKINVQVASIRCVGSYSYQYGYDYANVTYIYLITDSDGNTYKWNTTKSIDVDTVKSLCGKIKAHEEYKGMRQTVLTRCNVA